MFLIVGLGNPGGEYANTRHNVGFMTVNDIRDRYTFSPFKAKFDGLLSEGNIGGEKVILLKPQTYMNLSGNSVVKAAHFYKILPHDIIVIHDDIDLRVGQVKAKIGGGTGGHNGLKSLDAHITAGYNRIRIGVGSTLRENVINHVLSRFSKQDEDEVYREIDIIAENIGIFLREGIEKFSSKLGELIKDKK